MKLITKLEDCTPDPHNANAGTLRGEQLLEKSLRRYGAGRGIVVDRNGVTIGGAKTLQLAIEMGLAAKVIQSDGTKLIAVVRTDLDLAADPDARVLAYLDNRAAEMGLHWDADQLAADLAAGIDLGGLFTEAERQALLDALDTDLPAPSAPTLTATLVFQTPAQREQWLVAVQTIATYPGATFAAQLTAWVEDQLVALA